jgi:hypothetical protein
MPEGDKTSVVSNMKQTSYYQSVNFERTWWKLFLEHIMCTNLDIYVFINFDETVEIYVTLTTSMCFICFWKILQ